MATTEQQQANNSGRSDSEDRTGEEQHQQPEADQEHPKHPHGKWTRPQSTYQQHRPTGEWVDQYTKRRTMSRAFNQVSQEEVDEIVTRLRTPTVSSTGAETLRDKQYSYTTPKYTKTNPRISRNKPEPRTPEECEAITQRLFSAKTRAWTARREKNPNTRVHYSTDFTII